MRGVIIRGMAFYLDSTTTKLNIERIISITSELPIKTIPKNKNLSITCP